VNKLKTSLLIMISLSGCTSLPEVSVVDDLADEDTRGMVKESVWVVDAEKARRFDDPAWPAPIQVVSPERDGATLTGAYDITLFDHAPSGQRIDVMYVEDGDGEECLSMLTILGVSPSGSAWIKIGSGGENTYRCASVLINTPKDLKVQNPLISASRKVKIVSMGESSLQKKYPIKIRYLHD
jgi:hypothetical protein